jgi:hypothetical protein
LLNGFKFLVLGRDVEFISRKVAYSTIAGELEIPMSRKHGVVFTTSGRAEVE